MITVRHSIETVFFIGITMAVMLFVMVQRNNSKNQSVFSAALPVVITPMPTPTPKGPQISIMDSPEGSKTLTLEMQQDKDITTYTLSASSKSDNEKKQLFKKVEPNSQILSIPFNTWSTDNVYVFLKEKTPSMDNYLVFQSSGNVFPDEAAFVSIQELFSKKVPGYVIEDVTGWAGPTSLIVNTKALGDSRKVSFWFEVPSQSFIQLSTYFN